MPVLKGVVFLAMMSSGSHFSLNSTHLAIDDVASVVSVISDHVVRSDMVGTATEAAESVAFRSIIRSRLLQVILIITVDIVALLKNAFSSFSFSARGNFSLADPVGLIDTYIFGRRVHSSAAAAYPISSGRNV